MKLKRPRFIKHVGLAAALLLKAAAVLAQNAATPGEFTIEPPTLENLGFEWKISGDENRNATVRVQFRKCGGGVWREGLPLLRIGDEQACVEELAYVTPRMFAGSILDLEPDTEYECRFEMVDPDGVRGRAVQTATVRTRRIPKPWQGGRVRHVYPKDWQGPPQQPAYHGLLHAYYGYKRFADWNLTGVDPVRPGDVLLLHAGVYKADFHDYRDYHGVTFTGTYELTVSGTAERPITLRAAGDGEVVLDGNGAHRFFDVSHADHLLFEGLTIRNTDVAFFAGSKNIHGPEGLTVVRCRFENIGIGVQNEFAGSRDFYIADNVFEGRHDRTKLVDQETGSDGKPFQHVRSYYAVKVAGAGHVVAHNSASYFFDGFDISTYGVPDSDGKSVAIDICGNDVFAVSDNGIEADGGVHNIRVVRNRVVNCGQQPYTFQPLLAGPGYLIRNVSYHSPHHEQVKFWGMRSTGVLVYHNTLTGAPSRHDQGGSNVHFRNNIFLTQTGTALPIIGVKTYTAYTSYDYNAYRLTPTPAAPFLWHAPNGGVSRDFELSHAPAEFPSFAEFQKETGHEEHGIIIDYADFASLSEPCNERLPEPGVAYRLYGRDAANFTLKPTSKAIDAGVRLPNVNDDCTGQGPDLGAIESGKPLPVYGPRTTQ